MNQLAQVNPEEYLDDPVRETQDRPEWVLKALKPNHLQICSLLAQGFKNVEVAAMTGVTKEYITMLLRQPLIKQEIARKAEVTGQRLELMFEKSVDVIADAMNNGNHVEKLKAARLHGELTKRIGRPDPMALNPNVSDDRLERLATRLEGLLDTKKGGLYDEKGNPIFEEGEIVRERTYDRSTDAQPSQGSDSGNAEASADR